MYVMQVGEDGTFQESGSLGNACDAKGGRGYDTLWIKQTFGHVFGEWTDWKWRIGNEFIGNV